MAICKKSQNMSGAKVTIALMEPRRVAPIAGCRRRVVLPATNTRYVVQTCFVCYLRDFSRD